MSAETRAALEDAIAAHMADENDGAQVISLFAIAAGVTPADPSGTRYVVCDGGAPWHETAGLLVYADKHHDEQRARAWEAEG